LTTPNEKKDGKFRCNDERKRKRSRQKKEGPLLRPPGKFPCLYPRTGNGKKNVCRKTIRDQGPRPILSPEKHEGFIYLVGKEEKGKRRKNMTATGKEPLSGREDKKASSSVAMGH